jgi:hypothetical protein
MKRLSLLVSVLATLFTTIPSHGQFAQDVRQLLARTESSYKANNHFVADVFEGILRQQSYRIPEKDEFETRADYQSRVKKLEAVHQDAMNSLREGLRRKVFRYSDVPISLGRYIAETHIYEFQTSISTSASKTGWSDQSEPLLSNLLADIAAEVKNEMWPGGMGDVSKPSVLSISGVLEAPTELARKMRSGPATTLNLALRFEDNGRRIRITIVEASAYFGGQRVYKFRPLSEYGQEYESKTEGAGNKISEAIFETMSVAPPEMDQLDRQYAPQWYLNPVNNADVVTVVGKGVSSYSAGGDVREKYQAMLIAVLRKAYELGGGGAMTQRVDEQIRKHAVIYANARKEDRSASTPGAVNPARWYQIITLNRVKTLEECELFGRTTGIGAITKALEEVSFTDWKKGTEAASQGGAIAVDFAEPLAVDDIDHEKAPMWFNNLPVHPDKIYFVGKGLNTDAAIVGMDAKKDAPRSLARDLQDRAKKVGGLLDNASCNAIADDIFRQMTEMSASVNPMLQPYRGWFLGYIEKSKIKGILRKRLGPQSWIEKLFAPNQADYAGAMEQIRKNNPHSRFSALREYLRWDDKNENAWLILVGVTADQEDYDQMNTCIAQCRKLDASFNADELRRIQHNAWGQNVNKAVGFIDSGKQKKDATMFYAAIEKLELAAKAFPDTAITYAYMAYCRLVLSDKPRAREMIEKGLKLDPKNGQLLDLKRQAK